MISYIYLLSLSDTEWFYDSIKGQGFYTVDTQQEYSL